jgi:ArsR family transcriptional regulator
MSKREESFSRAAQVLKALGHPLRLALACGLRHQPRTQTYIADKLGLPQSTVAQHLKVLRSEGLIKSERHGVEVVFSLADPALPGILDTLCANEEMTSVHSWEEIARVERRRRASSS